MVVPAAVSLLLVPPLAVSAPGSGASADCWPPPPLQKMLPRREETLPQLVMMWCHGSLPENETHKQI